jgi:hypothetical protein
MAGRFLALLMNALQQNSADSTYTLAMAQFQAVRELSRMPEQMPYGPRALIYNLIGNGSLRLCPAPTNDPVQPGVRQ